MSEAYHAIKSVALRTGLSTHVIRIWEKRYRAVEPQRTASNRRLYSDEQVERLSLLRELTQAGHTIASVAGFPLDKLRKLAEETPKIQPKQWEGTSGAATPSDFLEDCISAVKRLDARGLEGALKAASLQLGAQGLLQRVIAPLAQRIGDLWRDSAITAAHEHFASAVIRVFLGHLSGSFAATVAAPVLIVATPSGQLHELGALLVGAAAANVGWNVTYLGPSLPAAEIAGAALQNRARAVALSLVYPEDDPRLGEELGRLRELLPRGVPILAGGRAVPAYREALAKIKAIPMNDLAQLCAVLDQLRQGPHPKNL
jgi:DNA-binding transcriptional MerR regulator/methylmalonyl-CoA mutase cobalamin-binding subunit